MSIETISKNTLFAALTMTLIACGGGSGNGNSVSSGGGSGGGGSGGSGAENLPPNIDSVKRQYYARGGDVVSLSVDGAGDPDGDPIVYTWTQVEGPPVDLEKSGDQYTFLAPETLGGSLITIRFKLRASDNASGGTEDFIIVHIVPDPVVDAGEDKTYTWDGNLFLRGGLQNPGADQDAGEWIKEYSWVQTSGPPVSIINSDSPFASFSRSDTDSYALLEFELTATNYVGVSDSDTVKIEVLHRDAPKLEVAFPPPAGGFVGSDIDVFGITWARGCLVWVFNPDGSFYCGTSNSLDRVTVDAGLGPVTVNLTGRYWRVENLPLPSGAGDITLTVEAVDAVGRNHIAKRNLTTSDTAVGGGAPLGRTVALASNYVEDYDLATNDFDTIYVLSESASGGEIGLVPVDFETGNRGTTISDFSDSGLGPLLTQPGHMVLDAAADRFYVSGEIGGNPGIISVDAETGERSLVSGGSTGAGPAFTTPHGLALGPGDTLLVADTDADAVLSVDLSSGDREELADAATGTPGVEAPMYLGWGRYEEDPDQETLLVAGNITGDTYLYSLDILSDPVTGSVFSQNSSSADEPDLAAEPQELLAIWWGGIYVLNGGDDSIVEIDPSGNRTLVAGGVTGSNTSFSPSLTNTKGMTYSGSKDYRVLYFAGGDGVSDNSTLYAIDPVSGDKVILSR